MLWLITIGLAEEDPRFGTVFESLQATPRQRRPTMGLLSHCWRNEAGDQAALDLLRQLQALGLVDVLNSDELRHEWALRVPGLLWDALRGSGQGVALEWARYRGTVELLSLDELISTMPVSRAVAAFPRLLQSGEVRTVVVRGPKHNGRHTILGAVARAMGRGVVQVSGLEKTDDPRWRQVGTLALLLHALPVAEFELGPGETGRLPDLRPGSVPFGVVLGNQGGLSGQLASRAVTITIDMPDLEARQRHWKRCFVSEAEATVQAISSGFRLTAGYIHRAAGLARSHARLAGRTLVEPEDVLEATRVLNRQALDTLARRVPTAGDWTHLCVGERTLSELQHLERRCRHRERLPAALGGPHSASMNYGVRALFSGPSGTGKTLAARLLAASLRKDLYQLDLSAVVNKYIGETEKNLNRVFELAEELDVVLLLDEGDALLTRRTDVQNANDRYANLETNFLLQRLESFQGILIVTTNTRNRIDVAFERRMDVTVEFFPPDAEERWHMWQIHLSSPHAVEEPFLAEVASRCDLTGGQIRNAALHASLLSLDNGGVITTAYLEAAVRREYRKQGGTCPLRSRVC